MKRSAQSSRDSAKERCNQWMRSWYDGTSVKAIVDELIEVYARVYDTPPYSGDPFFQNQGLGRKVHDTVIAGHAESTTALTCIIDNQPAHDAYLRWGYMVMGEIKHAPESPTYDAMYLPNA
ncbi:GNAT family N-acetyltransferase [Streptomyces sp. MCA2]|uniref:GNAT family N-acetyltransferase n=1 Tax=Streptomyces sp. MCA2 TaxID=2944805 RepID=UPI002020DE0A|nr:GNAT family N-acetyltransferase [Streptomyces sp. MCA2]MCL7493052.1 GNAT family N-acetyltransferase [Streptomyces sp. MCA2]